MEETNEFFIDAFNELLNKYNEKLEEWRRYYGTKDGFDEWFTKQILSD